MKMKPVVIGALVLFGGFLVGDSSGGPAVKLPVPPPPQPPKPSPKPRPPITLPETTVTPLPPPPITLPANGRHLSANETALLQPYFGHTPNALDTAVVHFSAPPSSFASEDPMYVTQALTTTAGIWFRFANHEIQSPEELSILGHELVHWNQYLTTGHLIESPEAELPAYIMQVTIMKNMTAQQQGSV